MEHRFVSRRHALKTALLGGAALAAASRLGLLRAAEDTVPSVSPRPIDWEKDWDPAVGLWWKKGPGHTEGTHQYERLHALPNAAVRLHYFAMHHALEGVPVEEVLKAIFSKQDPKTGALPWYWESTHIDDTNSAFFTGMALIALWRQHADQLSPAAQDLLRQICTGLDRHFSTSIAGPSNAYYPNKWLGDLTCAWLLGELLERDDTEATEKALREAFLYWRKKDWGWGEHMSDTYAAVLLDEMSLLLLLSKHLPADIRRDGLKLLNELLAINDAFADGPRVPALRSYAQGVSPKPDPYRERVRPLVAVPLASLGNQLLCGPVLNDLGWHKLVAPRQPRRSEISVPCFGGTTAQAYIAEDIRLGTMSHFPIMPGSEHWTWGLAWQSFPVCFWRPKADWGFLQWETVENGRRAQHPAGKLDWGATEKALSHTVNPPPVGHSCSLQRGPNALVLRLMPVMAESWEQLTDRLRVVDCKAEVKETGEGPWSQLSLKYPERTVVVRHYALQAPPPVLHQKGTVLDWDCTLAGPVGEKSLVSLWEICLDGTLSAPPKVTPVASAGAAQAWNIEWPAPGGWKVLVDPLAVNTLREV
ncbi:MAG: hypothetical protein ACOYM3_20420 [Terrimicrobiaceae bacterium]